MLYKVRTLGEPLDSALAEPIRQIMDICFQLFLRLVFAQSFIKENFQNFYQLVDVQGSIANKKLSFMLLNDAVKMPQCLANEKLDYFLFF